MKTLKFLLLAGCVLGLELGSALGQGDSFSCTQCICVADNTCGTTSGCSSGIETGCAAKSFTASCTGQYRLKYEFDCSGATCASCYVCVFLKDINGNVVGAAHGDCTSGGCDGEGDQPTLTSGQTYKLYVCLRTCGIAECEVCSGCTARGYAYRPDFGSACGTIVCNP